MRCWIISAQMDLDRHKTIIMMEFLCQGFAKGTARVALLCSTMLDWDDSTAGDRNPWDQRIYFQDGFSILTSGAQPGGAEGEAYLALSTGTLAGGLRVAEPLRGLLRAPKPTSQQMRKNLHGLLWPSFGSHPVSLTLYSISCRSYETSQILGEER